MKEFFVRFLINIGGYLLGIIAIAGAIVPSAIFIYTQERLDPSIAIIIVIVFLLVYIALFDAIRKRR